MKIFRQGDVVLRPVPMPLRCIYLGEKNGKIRMRGETGRDRLIEGTRVMHMSDGRTLLQVDEKTVGTMTHPQHPPLVLASGIYDMDRVRMFNGGQTRQVHD